MPRPVSMMPSYLSDCVLHSAIVKPLFLSISCRNSACCLPVTNRIVKRRPICCICSDCVPLPPNVEPLIRSRFRRTPHSTPLPRSPLPGHDHCCLEHHDKSRVCPRAKRNLEVPVSGGQLNIPRSSGHATLPVRVLRATFIVIWATSIRTLHIRQFHSIFPFRVTHTTFPVRETHSTPLHVRMTSSCLYSDYVLHPAIVEPLI